MDADFFSSVAKPPDMHCGGIGGTGIRGRHLYGGHAGMGRVGHGQGIARQIQGSGQSSHPLF